MFMMYWKKNASMAAQKIVKPTCETIRGHIMNSPEPIAVAVMIALAPIIFHIGTASGRARYGTAGRCLLGSSVARLPLSLGWSVTSVMRYSLLSLGPGAGT